MASLNSKISELLSRGVVDVIEKDNITKKLLAGKNLRVKLGIDPTGPNIHIGRGATLRKLREFQDLGHSIVLIIGDATARIGDASDKNSARQMLSSKDIEKFEQKYIDQISRILDIKKVEIRHNSEWLDKLTPTMFVKLASLFTVQQMIERENFSLRIKQANPVGLQELLYPLLQGYDSVAIESDLEIGGTDQLFNLLAGRKIQEYFNQEPQSIMTLQLLAGTDGRKMSTSWGNVILITDEPNEKYGKIMRIADQLVPVYMECATLIPMKRIQEIRTAIESGNENPMRFKQELAYEIVRLYDGEPKAKQAQQYFKNTVQNKETPSTIPIINAGSTSITTLQIISLLVRSNTIKSKNEGKRLLSEKAVSINGKKMENDLQSQIHIPKSGITIKAGKRKFLQIVP